MALAQKVLICKTPCPWLLEKGVCPGLFFNTTAGAVRWGRACKDKPNKTNWRQLVFLKVFPTLQSSSLFFFPLPHCSCIIASVCSSIFFCLSLCIHVFWMKSHAHFSKHLCKPQSEMRQIVQKPHFIPSEPWSSELNENRGVDSPFLHLAQCPEPYTTAEAITHSFSWEKLPWVKLPSPFYHLLIAGHPGEDGGICTFDPNGARLGSLFCRLRERV